MSEYIGNSPNQISVVLSDDITTDSSCIAASTKCVMNAMEIARTDIDNNIVHTYGEEVIGGIKSFADGVKPLTIKTTQNSVSNIKLDSGSNNTYNSVISNENNSTTIVAKKNDGTNGNTLVIPCTGEDFYWKDQKVSTQPYVNTYVGSYLAENMVTKHVYSLLQEPQFLQSYNKTKLVIRPYSMIPMLYNGNFLFYYGESQAIIDPITNMEQSGDNSLVAGKDYYVFLVSTNGTSTKFVISSHKDVPNGYTLNNSRLIGGFHTLCANVGTISGHPLSGYVAGNILPTSVWCLNHRSATSSNDGMVYVKEAGIWVDIYLQSGTGVNTASKYGATHTVSRIWDWHSDDLRCVGKQLLTDSQFGVAAEGSNQQTAISGAKDWTTVGGHVDTANRRMISNYGCEEMCGYLWQWLTNPSANGSSGWNTSTGSKSSLYGSSYALLAGGDWDGSFYCGSWSRAGSNSRLAVYGYFGARGCSVAFGGMGHGG